MANVSNSSSDGLFVDSGANPGKIYYAVYDCCISGNIPSQDVAFIEERFDSGSDYVSSDEKCFGSLTEAKAYVKDHFKSGAEYFSLDQSSDPDNIFHAVIDKITYLMA